MIEEKIALQLSKIDKHYTKKKYLLAVSGGSDSICLTSIFYHLKLNFATAHCNFKLRNEESEQDELFVRNFILTKKIKGYFKAFNTKEIAEKNKTSIQEEARNLRYQWFKALKEKYNFDYIVTAHHREDNIETFFINSIRGTGIKGLTGIPIATNNIIRPMLAISKSEINQYLDKNNIAYRNDSSNNSLKYSRNYLRHKIIPLLDNVHPNAKKGINTTIENLTEANDYLQQKLTEDKQKLVRIEKDKITINISSASLFLLYHLVKDYGFNKIQLNNLLHSYQKGKIVSNSLYKMILNQGTLIITPAKKDLQEHYVFTKEGTYDTPLKISISLEEGVPNFSPNVAYLDASKVGFPFILRKWKKGDFFIPLGMKGKKKLSDFFVDIKLSTLEKEEIWILESNNKICWIVGKRQDNRSKITNNTTKFFKIVT